MANFTGLNKLAVSPDKTAEYTFPFSLTDDPKQAVVLVCVPAGQANKPLINAVLKLQAKRQVREVTTAESIDEGLARQVLLYPKYVVKGWKNVFDDDGKPAAFSVEECQKFLGMLHEKARDYLVEFFAWAQDLDNWRAEDAEAVAKN
jgi:hypothetical protein